jgi:hypothetical protein
MAWQTMGMMDCHSPPPDRVRAGRRLYLRVGIQSVGVDWSGFLDL